MVNRSWLFSLAIVLMGLALAGFVITFELAKESKIFLSYTDRPKEDLESDYRKYISASLKEDSSISNELKEYYKDIKIKYTTNGDEKEEHTGLTPDEMEVIYNEELQKELTYYIFDKTGKATYMESPSITELDKWNTEITTRKTYLWGYYDKNNMVKPEQVFSFISYMVNKDNRSLLKGVTDKGKGNSIKEALNNLEDSELKDKLTQAMVSKQETDYKSIAKDLTKAEKDTLVKYVGAKESVIYKALNDAVDVKATYEIIVGIRELNELTKTFN